MRVLTIGTFDLFHIGHVRLLAKCRGMGGEVIVGVNSDRFVREYKGRPPIIPYEARAEIIHACRYVDGVVENDGPGRACISRVDPDIIVVGSDWLSRDYLRQIDVTQEWLDNRRILLTYVPYTEGVSSTAIRAAIA